MRNNLKDQLVSIPTGGNGVVTFDGESGYASIRAYAVELGKDIGTRFRFKRLDQNSATVKAEEQNNNPYYYRLRAKINRVALRGDKDYRGLLTILKHYINYENIKNK